MLRRQLAVLALAATALVAYGCGESSKSQTAAQTTGASSSSSTTTGSSPTATTTVKIATGKPLTRAQLIAKADAICAQANKQIDTVSETTARGIEQGFPKAAVYQADESSELRKLVPPATMAHDWTLIMGDFQRYLEYAEKAAEYAKAKDVKAVVPLIKPGEVVHERLNAIAKRDGFKYCSTTE
jgi:hypothetical protein